MPQSKGMLESGGAGDVRSTLMEAKGRRREQIWNGGFVEE